MKKTILYLLLLTSLATAVASPITPDQARKVAETFWLKNLPAGCDRHEVATTLIENTGFAQFYIFDIDAGKGFVIVSADDCAYPVLGYSTEHPAGEMGANTHFWLNQYEQEIAWLVEQDAKPDTYIRTQWETLLNGTWEQPKATTSVNPLLTTTWNQSPYYNNYCPTGTPAGCTAIAVAQVMKFWNYPPIGTGSHSYAHSRYGTQSADFGNTTYQWENMPNRLTSSSTTAQVNAVATLCYHVGVAMNMDYDPSGSGAALIGGTTTACAQNALKNYFGYRTTLQGVSKNNYTDAAWNQMLRDELDAGRPVAYAGFDNSAGHAFVFHGYNSSGQYCVNWGWGGSYDGYFSMGALNPAGGGTGSNGSNTFNINNQCLIGVQPSGALRLSTSRLNLPQAGTAATFVVSSNTSDTTHWSATASESWVTLTPATGNGDGALTTVSVSATANTTGSDRAATVTVVQNSDTATLTVSQLACNPEDMCTLTVNMSDRYGDGWEGASLTFASTSGTIYGTASVGGGAYAVETIAVCPDTVVVTWQSGRSDSECGFTINNDNGIFFFNHVRGTSIATGTVLIIPAPCDTTGGIDPVTYTLEGIAAGDGRGQVTGGGTGLAFGTSRTLRAEANDGFRFIRWNDNSTDNPRSVVVTGDMTYTAYYATIGDDTLHYDNGEYNTALSAGSSMVWGIKFVASDLTRHNELTGVQFYNVYAGTYTLTIYQGGNISPTTQVYQNSITLSSQYTQRWITLSFSEPLEINRNKTLWITLKAPNVSYPAAMANWCGNENGSMISTNDGSSWKKLSQLNRYGTWMIRAIMPIDNSRYTVTLSSSNDDWGTVSGGGSFYYGDPCTVTATPNEGYHFVRWSNGTTLNTYTFTVTQNVNLTAHFLPDTPEGIGDVDGCATYIHVEGRQAFLHGAEGHMVQVFDIMGRCHYSSDDYRGTAITLPFAGVYMVRVDGGSAQRIVIQ